MKKVLSVLLVCMMVFSIFSFAGAASQIVEVQPGQSVVVTASTGEVDLAGYDNLWWTGTRYIWVNLSSNSSTDFPALVSPNPDNNPALLGGLGVEITANQQLHYFNEANTPGNVLVTLGTVSQPNKTFTIADGPVGTYTKLTCNVDPNGWPAPGAAFNIGAPYDISVTVGGTAVTLTDSKELVIKWVAQGGDTSEDTSESPSTGDASGVPLFVLLAVAAIAITVFSAKRANA